MLSPTQRKLLLNALAESIGRQPQYFAKGRSQHGGWYCAAMALHRKGFLDRHDKITEAGKIALESTNPEPHAETR